MAEKRKLTDEDDALLAELGIEIDAKKDYAHTSREERIIAGFEEIQRFFEDKGRLPRHGEDNDIFERLYAVRLDQIRTQHECVSLLKKLDFQNLLKIDLELSSDSSENINDDELLAQLGVDGDDENSITNLKHVKSRSERKVAEEIASRTLCEDFDRFKPLFDAVKRDIDSGIRSTVHFRKDAGFTKTNLKKEQFIIIGGVLSFLAEIGDWFKAPNGEDDARLRVVYANGTESNILLRSLIRSMYKDEASRFITEPNHGPLFSEEYGEDDIETGTIYVLRSMSDHPLVVANRNIVHKIGVTGGDIKKRLASAKYDPTFLMADVEIVSTYELANISRTKLEKIIHRFFSGAKLDIEIKDRFGKMVSAQEWFLVPVFIIDEMVDKVKDGTVSDYYYDPVSASLRRYKQ